MSMIPGLHEKKEHPRHFRDALSDDLFTRTFSVRSPTLKAAGQPSRLFRIYSGSDCGTVPPGAMMTFVHGLLFFKITS